MLSPRPMWGALDPGPVDELTPSLPQHANVYPGAACDIPVSFYSFSFAPSADFHDEWASQPALSKCEVSFKKRSHSSNADDF